MCAPYSSWSGAPKHWIAVPERRPDPPWRASGARTEEPQHSGRRGELATFAMAALLVALGAPDGSAAGLDGPPSPAPAT